MRQQQPSARTLEIIGKLGLRYPPANSVDREAHAARIALLAEDCADINPEWLDAAARDWAKRQPFMPRACELRDRAMLIGQPKAAPTQAPEPLPQPEVPPLTDDEIRKLPRAFIEIGIKLGEIDPERAARLRPISEESDQSTQAGE